MGSLCATLRARRDMRGPVDLAMVRTCAVAQRRPTAQFVRAISRQRATQTSATMYRPQLGASADGHALERAVRQHNELLRASSRARGRPLQLPPALVAAPKRRGGGALARQPMKGKAAVTAPRRAPRGRRDPSPARASDEAGAGARGCRTSTPEVGARRPCSPRLGAAAGDAAAAPHERAHRRPRAPQSRAAPLLRVAGRSRARPNRPAAAELAAHARAPPSRAGAAGRAGTDRRALVRRRAAPPPASTRRSPGSRRGGGGGGTRRSLVAPARSRTSLSQALVVERAGRRRRRSAASLVGCRSPRGGAAYKVPASAAPESPLAPPAVRRAAADSAQRRERRGCALARSM